jgi:hypothetical protein
VAGTESLTPLTHDDIPESYAAIGRGEGEGGAPIVVSFAPRHAGDAVLAGLATAARLVEEEAFAGELVVVAPQWSSTARRRLGLAKADLPFRLRPVAASVLSEGNDTVEAEGPPEPTLVSAAQVAAHLTSAADRDLVARAAAALEGLASKHGGATRAVGRSVELVVMARRVAELRADDEGVTLTTLLPQRSSTRLSSGDLAAALDGLEGQLRKRLNDRRLRDGEEGMRTRLIPLIATALELRNVIAWPLGGSDREALDLVGLDSTGRPVVGAARLSVGLPSLGAILDAALEIRPFLPNLMARATAPVRLEGPRLILAAQALAPGVARALSGISLAHEVFEIRSGRDQGFELSSAASGEGGISVRERPARGARRGRGRGRSGREEGEAAAASEEEAPADGAVEAASPSPSAKDSDGEAGRGRRGRSRRRGRRRGGAGDEGEGTSDAEAGGDSSESKPARFEEVSLFDLDDGSDDRDGDDGGRGRSRRRGRSRQRGRRGGSGGEGSGSRSDGESGEGESGGRSEGEPRARGRGRGRAEPAVQEDGDGEDDEDLLAELPAELTPAAAPESEYSDDDLGEEEAEGESGRAEREKRRRARKAEGLSVPEPPKPPRRRAVVVAHADRDSVLAAVLLARDIRLLEGLWVYPQAELMNFFREVTTDIRDDVPIYLVGFTPSPARDVVQAAALYRDRLTWFDHHEWPPEDRLALVEAIGADALHHGPGVGSSLPLVLETSTRRSRFSDKLVDLSTGRFSEHDYERWGRLWWWRLGEIAQKSGDVRRDIDSLLTGRPSELAQEAAKSDTPPVPAEVSFVSSRDFRLVHFAGYAMVLLEVDEGLDLHLCGRIARERYGALLSLCRRRGGELFVFGAEEQSGRRVLDPGMLSEHLAEKLEWVEALADQDHAARFRIRGLEAHPERLDEVVGEIAMGRSILER